MTDPSSTRPPTPHTHTPQPDSRNHDLLWLMMAQKVDRPLILTHPAFGKQGQEGGAAPGEVGKVRAPRNAGPGEAETDGYRQGGARCWEGPRLTALCWWVLCQVGAPCQADVTCSERKGNPGAPHAANPVRNRPPGGSAY